MGLRVLRIVVRQFLGQFMGTLELLASFLGTPTLGITCLHENLSQIQMTPHQGVVRIFRRVKRSGDLLQAVDSSVQQTSANLLSPRHARQLGLDVEHH